MFNAYTGTSAAMIDFPRWMRGQAFVAWIEGHSLHMEETSFAFHDDEDDSDLDELYRWLPGLSSIKGDVSLGEVIGCGVAAIPRAKDRKAALAKVAKTIVSDTHRHAVAWISPDSGELNYGPVNHRRYDTAWIWINQRIRNGHPTTVKHLQRRFGRGEVLNARLLGLSRCASGT